MFRKLLLVLSAAVVATAACSSGAPSGPIKIGYIWPQTGVAADYGPDGKQAIELRLEQANYTVAGRKIELVIGDEDALDATVTLERTKKLVEQDKVDFLLGPLFGSSQQAVGPYLADNKKVSLAMHTCSWELRETKVFVCWPGTDVDTMAPMGAYAYEKLGYRKLSTIAPDYIFGHNLLNGVADSFKGKGGTIVQQQWVPLGTVDLLPYATAVSPDADAIAIWLLPTDTVSFLKEYRNLKISKPLIFIYGLFEPYLQENGGQLEGEYGMLDYFWTIDNAQNKDFVAAFEKKYNKKPNSNNSNSYIVTDIALRALQATNGDTSYPKLRDAMLKLRWDSVAGPAFFSSNGFAVTSRHVVQAVKDGSLYIWKPIQEIREIKDPRDQ